MLKTQRSDGLKSDVKRIGKYSIGTWTFFLFVFAILTRVLNMSFMIFKHRDYLVPRGDAVRYQSWARSILEGDILSHEYVPFYFGPSYSYVMALIYKLTGVEHIYIMIFQMLLGVLSMLLIFHSLLSWFRPRVALSAAFALAFCSQFFFYENVLLPETLTFFFTSLFFFALSKADDSPGQWWRWLVLGISIGVMSIQRGSSLLIIGAVFLWLLFGFSSETRLKRAVWMLLVFAGMIVAISPVTLRNRLMSGQWVLLTANGPINFYIGNAYGANGKYWHGYKDRRIERRAILQNIEEMENALQEEKDPNRAAVLAVSIEEAKRDYEKYWQKQMIREIREHPMSWVVLMLKKSYAYFGSYDVPDNYSMHDYRRYSPLIRYNPIHFGTFAAFGFVGMFISFRNFRKYLPLYMVFVCFFLSIVIVFISGRFRLPVLPILAGFSSLSVWESIHCWRQKERLRAIAIPAAAAFLYWLFSLYELAN